MSPRFVLGRENVPCVIEVVNRSVKADCTDFIHMTDIGKCTEPKAKVIPLLPWEP